MKFFLSFAEQDNFVLHASGKTMFLTGSLD